MATYHYKDIIDQIMHRYIHTYIRQYIMFRFASRYKLICGFGYVLTNIKEPMFTQTFTHVYPLFLLHLHFVSITPKLETCLTYSIQDYSMHIWGLCCQEQVSQEGISNCIPPFTVGCDYFSLPEIPASDHIVHISPLPQLSHSSHTLPADLVVTSRI